MPADRTPQKLSPTATRRPQPPDSPASTIALAPNARTSRLLDVTPPGSVAGMSDTTPDTEWRRKDRPPALDLTGFHSVYSPLRASEKAREEPRRQELREPQRTRPTGTRISTGGDAPTRREREPNRTEDKDKERDRDRRRSRDVSASFNMSLTPASNPVDYSKIPDPPLSASSSTSSLDPYYFMNPSPPPEQVTERTTARDQYGTMPLSSFNPPPMNTSTNNPVTPARYHRDMAAAIDRRSLVGVGELATPRWATAASHMPWEDVRRVKESIDEVEPEEEASKERAGRDSAASLWTLEAVEREEATEETARQPSPPKASPPTIRSPRKPSYTERHSSSRLMPASAAEESGLEEQILYKPMQSHRTASNRPAKLLPTAVVDEPRSPQASGSAPPRKSTKDASSGNVAISSPVVVRSPVSATLPAVALQRTRITESPRPITLQTPVKSPVSPAPVTSSRRNSAGFVLRRKRTNEDLEAADREREKEKDRAAERHKEREREREREKSYQDDNEHLVRKHRSLGVTVVSGNGTPTGSPATSRDPSKSKERERRPRESLPAAAPSPVRLPSTGSAASTKEREREKPKERQPSAESTHSRHVSGSSVASRRHHVDHDYSHLPPSPGANAITQFLRSPASSGTLGASQSSGLRPEREKDHDSFDRLAHSLLAKGPQEGWPAVYDEQTVEALNKLDGVSKTPRSARTSMISISSKRSREGSRPGTPGGGVVGAKEWEGIEPRTRVSSGGAKTHTRTSEEEGHDSFITDEHGIMRRSTANANGLAPSVSSRSSYNAAAPAMKRSSTSSASAGTPTTTTTGSRDSVSTGGTQSTANTTPTSTSMGKSVSSVKPIFPRRNSAGSDGSGHSFSHSGGDASGISSSLEAESAPIPPVPPLPKELTTRQRLNSTNNGSPHAGPSYGLPKVQQSPASMSAPLAPASPSVAVEDPDRTIVIVSPADLPSPQITWTAPPPAPSSTSTARSPGKKWSFSSALHLNRPSSHKTSNTSLKDMYNTTPLSPRSPRFPSHQQSQQSFESRLDESWSTVDAADALPPPAPSYRQSAVYAQSPSKLGERYDSPQSRAETASSASTRTGQRQSESASAKSPENFANPLSPQTSIAVKRSSTTKRLTPSAIPFFRRASSSQTIPTTLSNSSSSSPSHQPGSYPVVAVPVPPSPTSTAASKKSSAFGLSGLLKSTSKKNLADNESTPKRKTDEKDRSESRISALMGRKRGKTVSAAEPVRSPKPVVLPPMQVNAIPPVTAQRVANLKSSMASTTSSSLRLSTSRTQVSPSPATHALNKSTDARASRQQLPTIAGSPSLANPRSGRSSEANTRQQIYESASVNVLSTSIKRDTPTKIPRISSRSSGPREPSPQQTVKDLTITKASIMGSRRASLNPMPAASIVDSSPSEQESTFPSEFGVLELTETTKASSSSATQKASARASPVRAARQLPVPPVSSTVGAVGKPPVRSFAPQASSNTVGGMRKSSTNSIAASITSTATGTTASAAESSSVPLLQQRTLNTSPLKPKTVTSKTSLPMPRMSNSATAPNIFPPPSLMSSVNDRPATAESGTPSPVSTSMDEDERLGDDEMMAYIKRQQMKKLTSGAKKEELDEMFKFPEPIAPTRAETPASLLRSSRAGYLSEYERREILEFPQVYYYGQGSDKKMATTDNSANNYGYDDERGDYIIVDHDHLHYRYEVISTLGKGSFGQVLQCRDHGTGESVAIKIIRNKKRFHHQALVEVKILENLKKWDPEEKHHVIKMNEQFYFRNHLCIAMELLSINLYELIKANGFVGFSTTLIRRFTSQMLASLVLMRHHRIVHCDLKPENVLLKHPCKSAIKVIDFGSSCFEHEKVYTYIQSRFYRSPEVILGMNYHMAIDMWSLGCILAELHTGFPIFPGENEQEQLACIMEVLGLPEKYLIDKSSRKRLFFESTGQPRPVVNSKGRRRRPGTKTLQQVLKSEDENFVDFIAKCLIWDPERRLKPQPALRHPFLTAGRRARITGPTTPAIARQLLSSTSSSLSSSSRTRPLQIGAPTPLAARVSNRVAGGSTLPTTPIAATPSMSTLGSASAHRTYRTPQTSSISYHPTSRQMLAKTNGYTTAQPASTRGY